MISKRIQWRMIPGLFVALLCAAVLPSFASSPPEISQVVPSASTQKAQATSLFIHLAVGSFDPLQALPDLPADLSFTPTEAAAAGTYIVQFAGPVRGEWKQAVSTAGGLLGDYLPDYAFLVHLDEAARDRVQTLPFVRWVGPYQPAYKLGPDTDYSDSRSYRIVLAPWADAAASRAVMTSLDIQSQGEGLGLSAVLDGGQIDQVARLADVIWIEPLHLRRLYNDVAAGTIMGGTAAWSNGYSGSGVTIAVTDTGLDTGNPSAIHQDFSGRVAHVSSWPVVYANYGGGCVTANAGADDGPTDVDSGHGTHVTGSLAGDGARSSGQFKGLGYGATITFQAVEQYTSWTFPNPDCPNGYYLTGIPDDGRDLLNEVYSWGARIQNYSWGGGEAGVYDQLCTQFDDFVYQHPDMTLVVSAGNDGVDANLDGYVDENSTTSPATAKNLITVGGSENERSSGGYQYTYGQAWPFDYPVDPTKNDHLSNNREHLVAFSSRGPLADGRIKPDVVAPGTNILSVRSSLASYGGWGTPYNAYYMYMGGTSMSSPLAAGAATLVREYYITGEGHANPSAALIKATLINSAVDITGYGNTSREAGQPIPNNHEGWGRVDVASATTPGKRLFVDNTSGVNTGATETHNYSVKAGQPLKVTLVWSDAPALPAAGKALVNDLHLRVTAPHGTTAYWGNNFSGGWSQSGGSADTVNNVENVYIQSPTAGWWTVEVIGQNVPQGPQPFALVVDGDVSLEEELTVTGISPTSAPNNIVLAGTVISGTGFETTSVVHLVHGVSVISGTNLIVDTDVDTIAADFDLNGATPGLWDVQVTNSSTQTATLDDAFTVIDALPDLRISKMAAKSAIEPGSWVTYTIIISNDGYLTATGVTFTDTLPGGTSFESLDPSCAGGVLTLPAGFACTIQGGSLAVGSGITYTLVISVPVDLEDALINHVVVGSTEEDGDSTDNSDQAIVISGGEVTFMPLLARNWPPVPGVPTLYEIENSDQDGNYTVSWAAGTGLPPTSYDLEENGAVILSGYAGTSYDFSGKAAGTYTYRVRGRSSYGSGPWSDTQSTDVAPEDPIQNGDFENGRDGSWTEYSYNGFSLIVNSFFPTLVTPHSGSWGVWLGGAPNEISSITQQVTVPAGSSTLSFWYWGASQESTCGNDFGQVKVGSTVVGTIDLCQAANTGGWAKRTLDLSVYTGQSVSLQIRAETNGLVNSNLFIDDVAFE